MENFPDAIWLILVVHVCVYIFQSKNKKKKKKICIYFFIRDNIKNDILMEIYY